VKHGITFGPIIASPVDAVKAIGDMASDPQKKRLLKMIWETSYCFFKIIESFGNGLSIGFHSEREREGPLREREREIELSVSTA
jgi:hypothetical protein